MFKFNCLGFEVFYNVSDEENVITFRVPELPLQGEIQSDDVTTLSDDDIEQAIEEHLRDELINSEE